MFTSFIAIGDSFTEGIGDELPDGRVRGWADLVATGLASAAQEPVRYANLAIRGRLLAPIVGEQLDTAIAMHPQLLSINGGGNDLIRTRVSVSMLARQTLDAVHRAADAGIRVLLLNSANPCDNLPGGRVVQRRGDELSELIREGVTMFGSGVTLIDNFADHTLRDLRYWSGDRMHLNAHGHARVASHVLLALGLSAPESWGVEEMAGRKPLGRRAPSIGYYREHVLPWIGRRITRRSLGDGRSEKLGALTPVEVEDFDGIREVVPIA